MGPTESWPPLAKGLPMNISHWPSAGQWNISHWPLAGQWNIRHWPLAGQWNIRHWPLAGWPPVLSDYLPINTTTFATATSVLSSKTNPKTNSNPNPYPNPNSNPNHNPCWGCQYNQFPVKNMRYLLTGWPGWPPSFRNFHK